MTARSYALMCALLTTRERATTENNHLEAACKDPVLTNLVVELVHSVEAPEALVGDHFQRRADAGLLRDRLASRGCQILGCTRPFGKQDTHVHEKMEQ
eukprot:SAG11_NODE_451_length_9386_cov_42.557661_5_plen_98_part_00